MRTEEIKIYKFEELDERAKEKARDWWREGGLDYEWWESEYESLKTMGAFLGFDIDTKKTYFNGFSHQGSGSAFTAYIDVKKMLAAIEGQTWKEEFPTVEFRFITTHSINEKRVIKAIIDGLIDVSASCTPGRHETSVRVSMDWDCTDCSGMKDRSNINSFMPNIEELVQDVADELNHWFYRSLESDYEYLTSDESVDETIMANEYEFTEDGERY